MGEQTPPAWYPVGDGTMRYWNGEQWTDHVHRIEEPVGSSAAQSEKKAGLLARRRHSRELDAQQQSAAARAAGVLVTSGVFGTSTIEVYSGGYVRIASGERADLMGRTVPGKSMSPGAVVPIKKSTPFEKLHSIEFTQPESVKPSKVDEAVGPAVSNLLKGGKNLIKASAPGLAAAGIAHVASTGSRTAYLTITTDREIHQLTNQGHNGFVKTTNKAHAAIGLALEAAGKATLQGIGNQDLDGTSPSGKVADSAQPASIGDRLRELAGLHREGILSDDEFAEAKARLLGHL